MVEPAKSKPVFIPGFSTCPLCIILPKCQEEYNDTWCNPDDTCIHNSHPEYHENRCNKEHNQQARKVSGVRVLLDFLPAHLLFITGRAVPWMYPAYHPENR